MEKKFVHNTVGIALRKFGELIGILMVINPRSNMNDLNMLSQLGVFFGTDLYPNWYILLMPLLLIILAGIALGIGTIISTITIKYRDMQVLFSFIVQIWMYATPIVYPLTQVNGEFLGINLNTIISLNPVTPIVRIFRYSCFGVGEFAGWSWLFYSFFFMVIILIFGIVVFHQKERNFMDTV